MIAGVVIAGFCAFLQLYAPQPLLALFRDSFGASEARVSLVVSAATFAVAIASPFVGLLADAIGRKRVIVPCMFALGVSTLACALAPTLDQVIAWRLFGGICVPGIIVVTIAYISEESPRGSSGSVMALYVTGTVIGGLVGRMAAAFFADFYTWNSAFYFLSILTFVGASLAWVLLPRSQRFVRQRRWRDALSSMAGHLRNGRLLATYAAGFCLLFCHVGVFTYINFYLAAPPFSLSTMALGSIFLVYALGIVVTPMSGRLVDRFGHRSASAVAVILITLGLLLTLIPSVPAIVIGVAIASSGVFAAQASASSHIGFAAKNSKSIASGLYVACYYLGGSAGATAMVVPWHLGGWPAVVGVLVLVQLIVLAITWNAFGRVPSREQLIPIE